MVESSYPHFANFFKDTIRNYTREMIISDGFERSFKIIKRNYYYFLGYQQICWNIKVDMLVEKFSYDYHSMQSWKGVFEIEITRLIFIKYIEFITDTNHFIFLIWLLYALEKRILVNVYSMRIFKWFMNFNLSIKIPITLFWTQLSNMPYCSFNKQSLSGHKPSAWQAISHWRGYTYVD